MNKALQDSAQVHELRTKEKPLEELLQLSENELFCDAEHDTLEMEEEPGEEVPDLSCTRRQNINSSWNLGEYRLKASP